MVDGIVPYRCERFLVEREEALYRAVVVMICGVVDRILDEVTDQFNRSAIDQRMEYLITNNTAAINDDASIQIQSKMRTSCLSFL